MNPLSSGTGFDTEVATESEIEVAEPSFYRVIFHNDNRTTMDFVIEALMRVFHKDFDEAMEIMLQVHEEGQGIAGVYTHEIAEQKTEETVEMARTRGFPLVVTFEEE